jgi:hypothetical protein
VRVSYTWCRSGSRRGRTHTKAWAQRIGILGSEQSVWSEERYDAADYPRFTASVHPDAPPAQLGLLCDWYVWLFYLDDHFCAHFKRDGHAALRQGVPVEAAGVHADRRRRPRFARAPQPIKGEQVKLVKGRFSYDRAGHDARAMTQIGCGSTTNRR